MGDVIFSFCTNPDLLADAQWWACYLTTGKHVGLYWAVGTVLLVLLITAPLVLALGFLGAMAARSSRLIFSLLGRSYIAIVRGVPDIAYFLFFVIALDQILEWMRHKALCRDWSEPIRQGNDFVVCDAAKLPLSSAAPWVHDLYGFALAVFTFGIVFGAFASNVIYGAMRAVPKAQLETGAAYGMTQSQVFWRILVPQMWVYALPGLGNIWILLIKATPLLFLLGIEDIVYWARELGGTKTAKFTDYPHGDYRMWYFFALLVFYLAFTKLSENVQTRLMRRLNKGQATLGGQAQARGST